MKYIFKLISLFVLSNLFSLNGKSQCTTNLCNCDTAKSQSPIDINVRTVKETTDNPFIFHFVKGLQQFSFKLANTTELIPATANEIVYNHATYRLLQIHAHDTSEHTLNGKKPFDFELHFVFQNIEAPKDFIVIGLLGAIKPVSQTQLNANNSGTRSVMDALMYGAMQYSQGNKPDTLWSFDLDYLAGTGLLSSFYTYHGSLTAPDCTENVTWIVCSSPVYYYISAKPPYFGYGIVPKYILGHRSPQKLNGRKVLLVKTKK